MLDWKDIKSKFSKDDLSNDDWLEPSKNLWQGPEVSPTKDERRRPILFWLTFGFISVLVLIGISFGTNTSKGISDNKVKVENESKNEVQNRKDLFNPNTDTPRSELKRINVDTKGSSDQPKSPRYKRTLNNLFSGTSENKKSIIGQTAAATKFLTGKNLTQDEVELLNAKKSLPHPGESIFTSFENLGLLPVSQVRPLKSSHRIVLLDDKIKVGAMDQKQNPKKAQIGFGLGVSLGFISLNQAFSNHLAAAQFEHSTSQGVLGWTEYIKIFNNGWKFKTGLSFERIEFESSHNSQIIYLTEEESDFKSDIDLVLSSPVGNMTSNLIMTRSQMIVQDQLDVDLDLANRHIAYFINLDLGVAKSIYSNDQSAFDVYGGLGINYLSGLNNQITTVQITNQNFESVQGVVTQNQQSMHVFQPTFNLGGQYQWKLDAYTNLSFATEYRGALNSFYEEQEYSSKLRRIRTQLGVLHSF